VSSPAAPCPTCGTMVPCGWVKLMFPSIETYHCLCGMYFEYQEGKPYDLASLDWGVPWLERMLWFWFIPDGQLFSLTDEGADAYADAYAKSRECIRLNQSLCITIGATRRGRGIAYPFQVSKCLN